jgi:hypothetical protein
MNEKEPIPDADADPHARYTPARQVFLAGLEKGLGVLESMKEAGLLSVAPLYRTRHLDPIFARDWDEAIKAGTVYRIARLEAIADKRATTGVQRRVFSGGRPVFTWHDPVSGDEVLPGTPKAVPRPVYETEYSDSLLRLLMCKEDPSYRDSSTARLSIGGDPQSPPIGVKVDGGEELFDRIAQLTALFAGHQSTGDGDPARDGV